MDFTLLAISIASILVMSLGGVGLPLWLGGIGVWDGLVIDVLTYFTGGVFLGAGMIHMLPEAAEEAREAGGIADGVLFNPFITFCLGFILVYSIEQMQHRELKKHSVLAVAQRARTHSATASICIVDVPPVTTYHSSDGVVLPKRSGLLEALNPAEQSNEAGTLRHTDRGYSHGSGPGSPHMHGHGHGHADAAVHSSHDHGHGGDGPHDCCAHDGCAHHDEDASTGHSHEHSHAAHAAHDHGHADHAAPSPDRSTTAAPPTSTTALDPLRLPPSHGTGSHGSSQHGSPRVMATAPHPTTPSPSRRPSSSSGWVDEVECCGGGGNGKHDHEHVHTGVRHKHVPIGGHGQSATLPLVLALLFSVHSFIAGLALGIQSSQTSTAVSILIAILGHKLVEALSLASSFVREGVRLSTSVSVLATYCLMTPLGIVAGASVLELGTEATAAEALISGFAAGSFVFLAAHELTTHASTSELSKTVRTLLALGGMGCMAVLAIWT